VAGNPAFQHLNFEALYYNGQRRLRARLGSTTAGVLGQYYRIVGPVPGYNDRFYYNAKDLISINWSILGSPVGFAQAYNNNDYWNTTENFASTNEFDAENSSCQNKLFYDLTGWQALGEDIGSL
jgi:hypothetical protein